VSGHDIDGILERIGSADLNGRKHSVLLTFRLADGSERPFDWSPTADLEQNRKRVALYIARTADELVYESLAGQPEALEELKSYVLGLSDDHRPSCWDTEFMDEFDVEYFERDLRNAMKGCVGGEDDAFRVAYRLARSLQIEGDIGIIAVAESLIRRTAELRTDPELLDRASEILARKSEEKSQMLRLAFGKFAAERQESRSGPSL